MFGVGICEMNRRVRRKCARGSQRLDLPNYPETEDADNLKLSEEGVVDWTRLPDDTVLQLFTHLNYRDRANLSSTCKSWRSLGASPCLWQSLDLRAHKCDWGITDSLASRCSNLQKLRFRGADNADSLINLRAKNLKELSGDYCRKLTDSTLAVIVARHKLLESLQLGPDFCERVSSDAIVAIGFCCPNLRKLRLSGIRDVNGEAVNALAKHCPNLTEIGFIDCLNIDEVALANVVSLRFLSVAGTTNVKWGSVGEHWSKLPNLKGLDVSRTDVVPNVVVRFFSSLKSLKILCAFNCSSIEEDTSVVIKSKSHGKMLLSFFNDTFKDISPLFPDTEKERDVFSDWRKESKKKDENLDEIMTWLEWILSHSLLRIAESNPHGLDQFWLSQGRAEAVMKGGGIQLLLGLARSWKEGLQSEATKAIANLSVNPAFAKSVAGGGGITILASLARSMNRLVAEEAAGGLWNLSVGEEHKGAIAEAGGIKALVDLIFKWPRGGDGVLERAAGALANLAADDKCSMEVANVGGINALVTLARKCKHEGVQEQAARALANLAAHGDSNTNNAAVGQETGALEALVLLIRSQHDGVRQEAAGALWNLSFDDRNREGIASAGGVEALVALAHSCSNASPSLQERAAGALWGLSVSEANSIAIGREGGVAPLISLARSQTEDVHETAAGALWNLAFNPGNALRIVEDGGVPALIHLCSSSLSKMARFMAALALAYMFDGRMDEYALIGSSSEGSLKSVGLERARRMALKHIETFVLTFADPQAFSAAALSSAPAPLAQVTDSARILEAGHLRCSGAEIGRFVAMLRNQSPVLKACAAFALLQFTVPGGRHAPHHVNLLQVSGAPRVLRAAAAAASAPLEAKIFARIVLRNLEHHQIESSV
ncbi:protein ARABIDILLO 1-like isoform X2 [Cynara cardunculus var. scolymus]|uniref:protein ARABIDILLO 1-like isoform X2 n=1 Tax=Cynara cardunculus var. scolymus TaxID=59895 RepID=UPI000D625953|nr:protein ARABIDILLO 1-like isoform X2 [Cynara cardunculus var. scolymus]